MLDLMGWFSAYWPLFYGFCCFLFVIVYLMIYFRTSRILLTFRLFFYPSVVLNFVLVTLAYLTQVRTVSNSNSIALLCNGECKGLGAEFCLRCYSLMLIFISLSRLINLHSIYYLTMMIKWFDPSKAMWEMSIFSYHYLIPLLTLGLTYFPQQDHKFVRNETMRDHPDYKDLDKYQEFGGFSNSRDVYVVMSTMLLALTTVYVTVMGCYWRSVAVRLVRSQLVPVSSQPTQVMFQSLLTGLTVQVVHPLFCYFPGIALYCWSQYSGDEVIFNEYAVAFLGTLPCLIDPIVLLIFVLPYRRTMLHYVSCKPLTELSPPGEDDKSFVRLFSECFGLGFRRSIATISPIAKTESSRVYTSMDRILDDVAAVYYPLFFITCLFLQFLLFWLIFTKTSKVLRNMRWFLYPSNITNFVLSSLAFFLQGRTVNNKISMAIMCQGPCKYLGPMFCFHGYVLILSVATVGGVLNMHTLFYRMVTIKFFEKFNYRVLVFCLWYTAPLLVFALSYIPPTNFEFVYLETLETHPEYDFEPYLKFGGFANSHHVCMTLVTLVLVALASTAPMLGFYWRRETLKILDKSYKSLSEHSIMQFRALIHGLSLQILLPLFCYVPVGFFYIYNKYSGTQIVISQYTLVMMFTLPAALDPILQISFIVPYRNAVKSIFLCRRARIDHSENAHLNTITLWNRRKSSQPKNVAPNNTV